MCHTVHCRAHICVIDFKVEYHNTNILIRMGCTLTLFEDGYYKGSRMSVTSASSDCGH